MPKKSLNDQYETRNLNLSMETFKKSISHHGMNLQEKVFRNVLQDTWMLEPQKKIKKLNSAIVELSAASRSILLRAA